MNTKKLGCRLLMLDVPADAWGDGKEPDLAIEVSAWRATRFSRPAEVIINDWQPENSGGLYAAETYSDLIDLWLCSDDGQAELVWAWERAEQREAA